MTDCIPFSSLFPIFDETLPPSPFHSLHLWAIVLASIVGFPDAHPRASYLLGIQCRLAPSCRPFLHAPCLPRGSALRLGRFGLSQRLDAPAALLATTMDDACLGKEIAALCLPYSQFYWLYGQYDRRCLLPFHAQSHHDGRVS